MSGNGHLYFGYGSNLNAEDYARGNRKPLKFQCMAFAPDCSLSFDRFSGKRNGGVLSLGDMPGAVVDGGLFAVEDWSELDRKEGVHRGDYVRIALQVLVPDQGTGHCHEMIAQTFVTASPEGFVQPDEEYLRICLDGREMLGLRTIDLEAAAAGKPNGFGHEPLGIFTYGTLCRGECREKYMRQGPSDSVSLAELPGMSLWRHSSGSYPCMMPSDESRADSRPVTGDLWTYRTDSKHAGQVSKLFSTLDEIENDTRAMPRTLAGIAVNARERGRSTDEAAADTLKFIEDICAVGNDPRFRRTFAVVNSGGQKRMAWTYVFLGPKAGLLPIVSGNWRAYEGRWDRFADSKPE